MEPTSKEVRHIYGICFFFLVVSLIVCATWTRADYCVACAVLFPLAMSASLFMGGFWLPALGFLTLGILLLYLIVSSKTRKTTLGLLSLFLWVILGLCFVLFGASLHGL